MKQKKIPVPEFNCLPEDVYMLWKPKQFFEHIMVEFNKANLYLRKAGRTGADLRELLVRYGTWSRPMNMALRKLMARNTFMGEEVEGEGSSESAREQAQYKLSYGFWWNRTHYIETYRKGFFGQIADRKKINQGMQNIRRMIEANFGPEEIKAESPAFFDLIERLAKKKELSAKETEAVLDGDENVRTNDF